MNQVISGAQIGADIAGLRAAKACGFDTGGFVPSGGRTKNGPLPRHVMTEFGLVETESYNYKERTEKNVQASDGTILMAYNWSSPGEKLTKRLLEKHNRPSFGITLERSSGEWRIRPWGGHASTPAAVQIYPLVARSYAKHVAIWLYQKKIEVLNIAGNGDEEIEGCVEWFLTRVFSMYKQMYMKDFNVAVQES